MENRIDFVKAVPGAYRAMAGLERYVRESGVEHSLLELVKIRSSQINGCAYCLDMHWKNARAAGESEQRLYSLDAWRETHFYSERERAALAWTEAVTKARQHFSEEELVNLTVAIVSINGWNRLMVSFRTEAGSY